METAIKYNLAQLNTPVTTSISLKDFLKVSEKASQLRKEERLCSQLISSELEKYKVDESSPQHSDQAIKYEVMLSITMSNILIVPKEASFKNENIQILLDKEKIPYIKTTFWDADCECFQYQLFVD
jgi:hypothetical protein